MCIRTREPAYRPCDLSRGIRREEISDADEYCNSSERERKCTVVIYYARVPRFSLPLCSLYVSTCPPSVSRCAFSVCAATPYYADVGPMRKNPRLGSSIHAYGVLALGAGFFLRRLCRLFLSESVGCRRWLYICSGE